MSEQHMRRRVLQWLKPLDAIPVENPAQPGTPDVNYVEGWIELKKLNGWPKRREDIVRCTHFTPQQRNWLLLRCRKGGKAWLLLQVKNEWLLFHGADAAAYFGKVDRETLCDLATVYWPSGLRAEELRAKLKS